LIDPDSSSRALISNEEMHKIKKLKLLKFVQSSTLTDKPISDKLLVLSDKILHVWILSQNHVRVKSPGQANAAQLELTDA